MSLQTGLDGKNHVVVTDNYFSSVGLYTKLASMETYATGTVCVNCVELPNALKTLKNFHRIPQSLVLFVSRITFVYFSH